MNIKISEFAQKELEDAIFFYELQQSGLGNKFKIEVRSSIQRIVKHPNAWPIESGEVRKCYLYKFPYKILYSIQENNVIVLAIAHQHRKPGYWIEPENY
ncbi:MAG: type II toxin-antitoxin system RelE/ParE family toxin [Candidatus Zhuqueibacterota bacterium]